MTTYINAKLFRLIQCHSDPAFSFHIVPDRNSVVKEFGCVNVLCWLHFNNIHASHKLSFSFRHSIPNRILFRWTFSEEDIKHCRNAQQLNSHHFFLVLNFMWNVNLIILFCHVPMVRWLIDSNANGR